MRKPEYIKVRNRLVSLRRPLVMGIVNITPDSFYTPSRYDDKDKIVSVVATMLDDGASIIDVGGCSTRPGSVTVDAEEERRRVIPILKLLRREFPEAVISVDTFRSPLVREARYDAGIDIINDISGGTMDNDMFDTVAELNIPYIMMHMQGTPNTMHINPVYEDVVSELIEWFAKRVPLLLEKGVSDIIIDPGIGFGKNISHNFEVLQRLEEFKVTGMPLLAGISRKSLIWKTLSINPSEALNGTTALNMVALMGGADILRVHDVAEAVQTVTLFEKMRVTDDSRE